MHYSGSVVLSSKAAMCSGVYCLPDVVPKRLSPLTVLYYGKFRAWLGVPDVGACGSADLSLSRETHKGGTDHRRSSGRRGSI